MNKASVWMAGSLLSMGSVCAVADVIGASAGISYWVPEMSGTIQSGGAEVDLERDLGMGDQEHMMFFASLEHPVPVLPNAKFRYFDMGQVAYGTMNTNFKGQTFSGNVQTDLDLSHYEFILYYELLDNIVEVDLGVNVKLFDGYLRIRQTSGAGAGTTSKTDFSQGVPMLYANVGGNLPFTGLSAGVELSAIGYSDSMAYDAAARIRQRIAVIAFEAGYRAMKVELDDISNVDVNIDVQGPYLSAMVVF